MATKQRVNRPDHASEYHFAEEGCYITELWNDDADPAVSIARARVEPGVTTRWHSLRDTVERYVILSGSGLVELSDAVREEVGPGSVVVIPAGVPQRIANTGGGQDLVFLAICSPRFTRDAYTLLESLQGD